MLEEHKLKPTCFTKTCEIEDVAPNVEYNRIVNAYLSFKRLGTTNGLQKVQEKYLEQSGLSDEPDLLLAFEGIFDEALERRRKQTSIKETKKSGTLRR